MDGIEDSTPTVPSQEHTPLFHAENERRYIRQDAIRNYEQDTGRSLVVFWGPILSLAITEFTDAIRDTPQGAPLDVMVTTIGGDGETALRMASICRAERDDVRVIVPDMAYSSGTILALAADTIVMSSTSTLGPIDPQMSLPEKGVLALTPARAIVEAVENLQKEIRANPDTFPFHTAMLSDINALKYQTAKDAMDRTGPLAEAVCRLRANPPSNQQIDKIVEELQKHSVHSATINHQDARDIGLPVEYVDLHSEQWDRVWRLHTRYVADYTPTDSLLIEGRRLSHGYGRRRGSRNPS